MARWNVEQPKLEDKDAILAADVGVFVKKRPCQSQAFQLYPSTLLSRSKLIWSPLLTWPAEKLVVVLSNRV